MAARRVANRIGVYHKHTPSWSVPDFYIDAGDAVAMVARDEARVINRGKALRLKHADGAPKVRDASCHPKERHVVAYVDASMAGGSAESTPAMAMMDGWRPSYQVGVFCPWPPRSYEGPFL